MWWARTRASSLRGPTIAAIPLLEGARSLIKVLDEQGATLATFEHLTGVILPGASGSAVDYWTAPDVGSYGLELELWVGDVLHILASGAFQVTAQELALTGTLELDPSAGFGAGDPVAVAWIAQQTAGEALPTLSLRWMLRSVDTVDDALVSGELVVDPFEGTAEGALDLPTEGLAVGDYLLTFEAQLGMDGPWTVLDGMTLEPLGPKRARGGDHGARGRCPASLDRDGER